MTSLTNPIDVICGNYTIDASIVPSIRNLQIEFTAHNLKPYVAANCFFDDTYVNPFVQPASILTTNTGVYSNAYNQGEGLYCNVTHAYAEVIDFSMANTLYVNENFVTINVATYGTPLANSFAQDWYSPGDIVYQAKADSQNSEANTVLGTVRFWNYRDSALVIEINNGIISTAANANVIFKLGTSVSANGGLANAVTIVHGGKFPPSAQVASTLVSGKNFTVGQYTPLHGTLTAPQSNTNQLILNANVGSAVVNSNVSIVSGDGIGQTSKIVGVTNNNILVLGAPMVYPIYATGGRQLAAGWAIGSPVVDDVGRVAGIFNIPEDQNLHFATGNRLFTINDGVSHTDPDASMRATAIFAAAGSIAPSDTSSQTPVVSQTPTMTAASNGTIVSASAVTGTSVSNGAGANNPQANPNPLAQTFTVPTPNTNKQSYGIFATSIDLFFQNKPTGNSTAFPVQVKLATVQNGLPTTQILATATVECADVNVTPGYNAISNTGIYPDSSNNATLTKFTFGDPVYLAPATEYAIIVYSESPDYDVWTANVGDTQVNSTRLVSQAAFVNSFYEAQNSSAWNAIPNEMLMFILNKAQFSQTPVSILFEAESPTTNTYMDMAVLHSSDLTFPIANISYSMLTTIANTGLRDTGYFTLDPNGAYNFGSDLKNSSLTSNRRRVIYAGNGNSTLVQATLFTTDPDVSPMFNSERLSLLAVTNLINPGTIDVNDISINSPGAHSNAANIVVTITAPTGENPITANARVTAISNGVPVILVDNAGSGYIKSPTLTFTETGVSNVAIAAISGETNNQGGNADTRYITKTITLADGFDAGDLAVFVDGIRPQGTDIQVYYKVKSGQDTEDFANKHWHEMTKVADVYSDDQNSPITLQFNTGGSGHLQYVYNGTTYPIGGKFKYFAIKICLFANDPTVPPIVQDYRAVAVPAG